MTAPRNLAATFADINAATPMAAAAMTGEPVGAATLRRIRASLNDGGKLSQERWRSMPLEVRELILTMACPDLDDVKAAAWLPWPSLTEDQRAKAGAYARWLRKMLDGSAWLTI